MYSQSAAFGSYCEASGGKLASLAGNPAAARLMNKGCMQSFDLPAFKLRP